MANFYNEILLEHNQHPYHKCRLDGDYLSQRGYNSTCGDDIVLQLKLEKGIITEGAFTGAGCAISQASCDMMLDLIIGKSEAEALRLTELFMRMIKGKLTAEELDELEEAGCLSDISYMPARVKCATLGWHTLEQILTKKKG